MFEIGDPYALFTAYLPITYSLAMVQVLAIILNYGIVYAALYRSDLGRARKNVSRNVLLAALLCLPGLFTTFSIIKHAELLAHGIKFWPVETERFSRKWYEREMDAIKEECTPKPVWRPRSSNNSGRCHSIW